MTRPKVTPEERRTRRLISARSSGLCETCLTARATDASHRKRRSQGGVWCPTNTTHQCRPCHRRTDSGEPKVNELGWHLKSWQDPATTPIRLARLGWVLLKPDGTTEPCAPPKKDAA